jgi:hypothetical protein
VQYIVLRYRLVQGKLFVQEAQLREALTRSLVVPRLAGGVSGSSSGGASGATTPGQLTARSSDAEDRALLASHRGERKDAGLHRPVPFQFCMNPKT